MALTNAQLGTMAAVLIILFAVIVFNNVVAARDRMRARAGTAPGDAAPGKASSSSSASSTSEPVDPLLVKFARHEGSVVGETVATDGDRLILKQGGTFKSVGRSQAEVRGDEVVLTGPIDWAKAEADGAAWHAGHRAAPIAEVSGALTRSEDVKSPALDATKDR